MVFLLKFTSKNIWAWPLIQWQQSKVWVGELRPEISFLHMKVLTLIKAKSYVFL